MASLTRPVKAWGLLAARADDSARVEPRKAVARAMANLEQTDLIRTFLLGGFLLDAMMANSLSSHIQNNTENAHVGISPFAAGTGPTFGDRSAAKRPPSCPGLQESRGP